MSALDPVDPCYLSCRQGPCTQAYDRPYAPPAEALSTPVAGPVDSPRSAPYRSITGPVD